MKRFFKVLVLLTVLGPLSAERVDSWQIITDNPIPEEYRDDEFKPWVKDILRFGIISVGAFPLAFGLSAGVVSVAARGSWSIERQLQVALISSGSLALGVAVADLLIGKAIKHGKQKHETAENNGV
jgi:hypothetical protein